MLFDFLKKLNIRIQKYSIKYRMLEDSKILFGDIRTEQLHNKKEISDISDAEFKVFSQWGDDGIIQYLTKEIDMPKIFIEFGVQYYTESNTRFLLMKDNWKGLVIDGGKDYINYIKKDRIYWQYDLTAVTSFITAENINSIFKNSGFTGEIGILSIDIDGNDYHIWNAINVVNPVVVIVEYNSMFGAKHPVTIPYKSNFSRGKAHYSNLYFGASIRGLTHLAERKGYFFIGCNSAGNNAYFVRKDKIGKLRITRSTQEGYIESKFREARNKKGELVYMTKTECLEMIKDLPVYHIERDELVLLKDI